MHVINNKQFVNNARTFGIHGRVYGVIVQQKKAKLCMKQQTKVCNKNIKLTLLLVLMEGCLLWLVVCLTQYIENIRH